MTPILLHHFPRLPKGFLDGVFSVNSDIPTIKNPRHIGMKKIDIKLPDDLYKSHETGMVLRNAHHIFDKTSYSVEDVVDESIRYYIINLNNETNQMML